MNLFAKFRSMQSKPQMQPIASGVVTAVQTALNKHGFKLEVDGVWGPATSNAVSRFKAGHDFSDRDLIGPKTATLLDDSKASLEEAAFSEYGNSTRWMSIASKYIGVEEIKGPHHNPQILEWWKDIGATWFDDDETPWCGLFVGAILHEAGLHILPPSQAPRARNWEKWGKLLNGPSVGAVVTFWRGSPSSGSGHVAFVVGRTDTNRLMCLGGNQSDRVCLAPYSVSRVTSYRWPSEVPPPSSTKWADLPIVNNRMQNYDPDRG